MAAKPLPRIFLFHTHLRRITLTETANGMTKGRLLHGKRPSFTLQLTAFRNSLILSM